MATELPYKIWFLAVFGLLAVATVQAARTLRGRPEGRASQIDHELPVLRVLRPVLGLVFYGALFEWLLPGTRLEELRIALPASVRWAGGAVMLTGVLLAWWSFRSLGRNYRGGVGLWEDHQLVVRGAYRWVRHPVYAAFVGITLGVGTLSANWLLALTGLVLTLSIPALRLRTEERQLRERFGEDYRRYEASTARFVPGVF